MSSDRDSEELSADPIARDRVRRQIQAIRDGDESDIANEPRLYRHLKCDSVNLMPAECIRNYTNNPFHYNDTTLCAECDEMVPNTELVWQDTEISLAD